MSGRRLLHHANISRWPPPSNRGRRRSSLSTFFRLGHVGHSAEEPINTRAFSVAVSRAWNGLPSSVRAASSLSMFRQELKPFSSGRVFIDLVARSLHISSSVYFVCLLHVDCWPCIGLDWAVFYVLANIV